MNFDRTKSMIWKGVTWNIDDMAGGKLKFSQITKGKSTLNFVIDAMKVQNKKITG